ncbi:hypothetical protein RF11_09016 [Thelohanellus kitauei]|uniref:Uncharacterized protein n=1 Tax=Thelohanellus kitauei TaxID=669202 RepID=A0A0C2JII6_THEKT|nr:hypothetical protein RF11_09016 [Thelohanellus kitauei]
MLGKYNGVAAIVKREIHNLCELHCVAHREDVAVEEAWKQIPSMIEIETFLRTVNMMFSRSSVNNEKFQELGEAAESDVIAFQPLHEVRWLPRHLAVTALVRNYNTLIDYFTEELNSRNVPISNQV